MKVMGPAGDLIDLLRGQEWPQAFHTHTGVECPLASMQKTFESISLPLTVVELWAGLGHRQEYNILIQALLVRVRHSCGQICLWMRAIGSNCSRVPAANYLLNEDNSTPGQSPSPFIPGKMTAFMLPTKGHHQCDQQPWCFIQNWSLIIEVCFPSWTSLAALTRTHTKYIMMFSFTDFLSETKSKTCISKTCPETHFMFSAFLKQVNLPHVDTRNK